MSRSEMAEAAGRAGERARRARELLALGTNHPEGSHVRDRFIGLVKLDLAELYRDLRAMARTCRGRGTRRRRMRLRMDERN